MLGLRQEAKAEASLAALQKMMKDIARVRRDGQLVEIPTPPSSSRATSCCIEAGNRVPADGRLFMAATLEIEEAALTGESTPVLEGHRRDRGPTTSARRPARHGVHEHLRHPRPGELIVTGTGMDTEIGHIADLLQTRPRPTRRRCRSSSTR